MKNLNPVQTTMNNLLSTVAARVIIETAQSNLSLLAGHVPLQQYPAILERHKQVAVLLHQLHDDILLVEDMDAHALGLPSGLDGLSGEVLQERMVAYLKLGQKS